MKLAIVIVSHNTLDLLHACLQSVFASAAYGKPQLDVDVIVIDNASHDGSANMVAAHFPRAHLIASDSNLGFTSANNLALDILGFGSETRSSPAINTKRAGVQDFSGYRPDYVLLLNPDTQILRDTLNRMVEFLESAPDAGACGASLIYGDGSFQHGAFCFPNLFQVALDFFPLTHLPATHRLHNSGWNGRYNSRLWDGDAPFPVDFVLGAAVMVRGAVISQIGGLDDRYFMYCEEMDWCLRMGEAGWTIYAVPDAYVVHHEAQSSRQVRWSAYEQLWRSRFLFFAVHGHRYPPLYLGVLRAIVRLGLGARRRSALGRFARGEVTGVELADELDAYAAIARM